MFSIRCNTIIELLRVLLVMSPAMALDQRSSRSCSKSLTNNFKCKSFSKFGFNLGIFENSKASADGSIFAIIDEQQFGSTRL